MKTAEQIIKVLKERYIDAHCNPDFKGDKMEYIFQPLPEQTESAEECAGHSKISPTYTNHQPTYTGTIDYRLLEKAIRDNCNIEYSRTTGEEVVNSSLSAVCIAVEEYAQSHQVEMPSGDLLSKEFTKGYKKGLREGYKDGLSVDKSEL